MDFDIEDRICLKSLYYLDDETHQMITELIKRARTKTNRQQAGLLSDWADSLSFKAYTAEIEMVGEF